MAECGDLQRSTDSTTIRVRSGGRVDGWVTAYSSGAELLCFRRSADAELHAASDYSPHKFHTERRRLRTK